VHDLSARGSPRQQDRARIADLESLVGALPGRFNGGAPQRLLRRVVLASHGFSVGNVVRHTGSTWAKSQADTPEKSHHAGIVVAVPHTGLFILALPGSYVDNLTSLTAGMMYVDASTAGALVATAPANLHAALWALSTTTGIVLPDSPCLTVSTSDPGTTAARDGDLWFKY
jgi:hypothetical protein